MAFYKLQLFFFYIFGKRRKKQKRNEIIKKEKHNHKRVNQLKEKPVTDDDSFKIFSYR